MNKFIHQTSCAYLVIIILVRMMAMPISLLDYSLNQNYIAGNLCENRFNTAMHCSGKCYLSKQLAKSNENQGSRDQKGTTRNMVIDFFQPIEKPSFHCSETLSANNEQYMFVQLTGCYLDSIFHPPIV
jgi:hypothetical protein